MDYNKSSTFSSWSIDSREEKNDTNPRSKPRGFEKVLDKSLSSSFRYAFAGVWHALKNNRNLRIDFTIALIVIILSIIFHINSYEKGILGITILIVICSEMINTSLEEMVNLITQEHRKEAKIAKDVAAGMVLIAAIGSVIIGIFIFAPYILKLFY